jgi:hypothetical protein
MCCSLCDARVRTSLSARPNGGNVCGARRFGGLSYNCRAHAREHARHVAPRLLCERKIMNRLWLSMLAVMLSGLCSAHANAADSGLYIGGGIGSTTFKDDPANPSGSGNLNFDSSANLARAFIGYRLTVIPLIDLAAEAGYNDFGKPSQTVNGQNLSYKLTGADAAGLVIFPLGPLDLYGKAGVLSYSADKNVGGTTTNKSGTSALYGVGIGVKVWKLGIRAEYDYYNVSNINKVQGYAVDVLFQF